MPDTLKLWAEWATTRSTAAWSALCLYYSHSSKSRYRSLDEWEKGRLA